MRIGTWVSRSRKARVAHREIEGAARCASGAKTFVFRSGAQREDAVSERTITPGLRR